jgi:O-antigen ligase
VLAAFPVWSIGCVLVLWTVWRQKILVGLVAAVTFASPLAGLCAVAALTPFGAILERALDLPFRLSEEIVLAFLAAWLVRAGADRRGPRMPRVMGWSGWLLGTVALMSVAVLTLQRSRFPGELAAIATWVRQAYFINAEPIGLVDAMRLVEGLALVVAAVSTLRQRPQAAVSLPATLSAAGAAAAAVGMLISRGIGPAFLVARYAVLGYRTAFLADPNAGGSYFAFVTCVALGMTLRAQGRRRALWVVTAILNVLGLWLSESRAAQTATLVTVGVAAAWLLTSRWPLRSRSVALAVLLAAGVTAVGVRAALLERDSDYTGSGLRTQFNEASLRMIAAHPLWGIGVGQYYATSPLFLSPRTAYTYGRENAHNYFLQVGVELGVTGLVCFAVWMIAALVVATRALAADADARLLGLTAGVEALLATCFVSHPLLVPEVAYPFWIGFGLMVGLAQSTRLNTTPATGDGERAGRIGVWVPGLAFALVLAGALVGVLRAPLPPLDSFAVTGLYPLQQDASGATYRWTAEYASVFVPASATRVYIPVRQPVNVRAVSPMGVTVNVNGELRFRTLVGESWVNLDVPLPPGDRTLGYTRIDFKIDRTWQRGIYVAGSGDMTPIGVQVGAYRVVESAAGG